MSRIITSNYIEKLCDSINAYDCSSQLNSIIDFMLEEIQKDQNRKGSRNQKHFSSNNLEKLNTLKHSVELRRIFNYVNIIINAFPSQFLHIHINADLSENTSDNIITLFTWRALVESSYEKDLLENEIEMLKIETKRDLVIADDNNGHVTNQIFRRRHGQKFRLKFIENISNENNITTNSGTLININTSASECVNLSEFSEFPTTLNTHVNFGNCLRNTFQTMGQTKVLRLSRIINIFPSITGNNIWYKDFLANEIGRYENFKKVITITSGEKTHEALLEMNKQKKFQANEIYTIFPFEFKNEY